MRDFALVVAGGLLAAVLTLLGHRLVADGGGEASLPVAGPEAAAAPIAPRAEPTSAASDPGRIEARLAELAAKVDALTAKLDARAERAPVPGAPAPAMSIDEGALVRALETALEAASEKAERAKVDAMTLGEATQTARQLLFDKKDVAAARRLLETVLERPLAPIERAQVMTDLGIALRAADDLDGSERALQFAVDTLGADSEGGASAQFQLAWTFRGKKQDGKAMEAFDRVARSAQAHEGTRLAARWNAAKMAHEAGNTARARADYESLLRDCAGKENYRHIADDVQARLRGM